MKVHLLQAGISAFLRHASGQPTDDWLYPHSMVNHFHAHWYNHAEASLHDRYDMCLRSDISQRWWKRDGYRPKEIMLMLIHTDPELAGIAWKDLAQLNATLEGRLSRFSYYCDQLLDMYRGRNPRAIETYHHQDASIMSLYLAGLFPDHYTLYPGLEMFQAFCSNVGSPDIPKVDDLVRYMKVAGIVHTYLQREPMYPEVMARRDPSVFRVQCLSMVTAYEIILFMANAKVPA